MKVWLSCAPKGWLAYVRHRSTYALSAAAVTAHLRYDWCCLRMLQGNNRPAYLSMGPCPTAVGRGPTLDGRIQLLPPHHLMQPHRLIASWLS